MLQAQVRAHKGAVLFESLMLFMVRSSRGLVRRRRENKDRKSQGNWKDRIKERAFKTKIMRQQHDQKGQTLGCHV